jgi:PAS domain S-box-containing protein
MAGENILVVEDESITALDIQRSLELKGYRVAGIACTGEQAVDLARETRPDLALMDIRLQGLTDGISAARKIREHLNIPVIFLTAYADGATLERAKHADPFAYLLKPFDEEVLVTTIEIALHKHRSHTLLLARGADELHLSEERFKRLADNLSEHAVLVLDPAGHIRSWSAGAERIYGWSAGEALGRHCSMLYPAAEIARRNPRHDLDAAVQAARVVGYGTQARKDSSSFSAQVVLLALHNTAGSVAGFLQITREVMPGGEHN